MPFLLYNGAVFIPVTIICIPIIIIINMVNVPVSRGLVTVESEQADLLHLSKSLKLHIVQ